jgi:hypothetical protein
MNLHVLFSVIDAEGLSQRYGVGRTTMVGDSGIAQQILCDEETSYAPLIENESGLEPFLDRS